MSRPMKDSGIEWLGEIPGALGGQEAKSMRQKSLKLVCGIEPDGGKSMIGMSNGIRVADFSTSNTVNVS